MNLTKHCLLLCVLILLQLSLVSPYYFTVSNPFNWKWFSWYQRRNATSSLANPTANRTAFPSARVPEVRKGRTYGYQLNPEESAIKDDLSGVIKNIRMGKYAKKLDSNHVNQVSITTVRPIQSSSFVPDNSAFDQYEMAASSEVTASTNLPEDAQLTTTTTTMVTPTTEPVQVVLNTETTYLATLPAETVETTTVSQAILDSYREPRLEQTTSNEVVLLSEELNEEPKLTITTEVPVQQKAVEEALATTLSAITEQQRANEPSTTSSPSTDNPVVNLLIRVGKAQQQIEQIEQTTTTKPTLAGQEESTTSGEALLGTLLNVQSLSEATTTTNSPIMDQEVTTTTVTTTTASPLLETTTTEKAREEEPEKKLEIGLIFDPKEEQISSSSSSSSSSTQPPLISTTEEPITESFQANTEQFITEILLLDQQLKKIIEVSTEVPHTNAQPTTTTGSTFEAESTSPTTTLTSELNTQPPKVLLTYVPLSVIDIVQSQTGDEATTTTTRSSQKDQTVDQQAEDDNGGQLRNTKMLFPLFVNNYPQSASSGTNININRVDNEGQQQQSFMLNFQDLYSNASIFDDLTPIYGAVGDDQQSGNNFVDLQHTSWSMASINEDTVHHHYQSH